MFDPNQARERPVDWLIDAPQEGGSEAPPQAEPGSDEFVDFEVEELGSGTRARSEPRSSRPAAGPPGGPAPSAPRDSDEPREAGQPPRRDRDRNWQSRRRDSRSQYDESAGSARREARGDAPRSDGGRSDRSRERGGRPPAGSRRPAEEYVSGEEPQRPPTRDRDSGRRDHQRDHTPRGEADDTRESPRSSGHRSETSRGRGDRSRDAGHRPRRDHERRGDDQRKGAAPVEDDLSIDAADQLADYLSDDVQDSSDMSGDGKKKFPTWEDAVGPIIEANLRQHKRGPSRPRRRRN